MKENKGELMLVKLLLAHSDLLIASQEVSGKYLSSKYLIAMNKYENTYNEFVNTFLLEDNK